MSEFAERFEDLRIWQDARNLLADIYREIGIGNAARDFGFRDQIQRAALSVMNNIAEGFERRTRKDFAHFLDQAKGSAGEVRSMLYAGEDLKYFVPATAQALRDRYEHLSRAIAAFTRTIRL